VTVIPRRYCMIKRNSDKKIVSDISNLLNTENFEKLYNVKQNWSTLDICLNGNSVYSIYLIDDWMGGWYYRLKSQKNSKVDVFQEEACFQKLNNIWKTLEIIADRQKIKN